MFLWSFLGFLAYAGFAGSYEFNNKWNWVQRWIIRMLCGPGIFIVCFSYLIITLAWSLLGRIPGPKHER
jgi:hypothetical protein